jgi:3-deoxy-D-manno-octulosonate 8-phosphate phosphatase (KDO 8-P phosphatase)
VFSTRDGIAVKLATDKGYNFCVISGGKNEGVRKRLNKLGIKNVYLGVNNKMEVFKSFMNDNNLKTTETMFMGDDIPDIQILKMVGLSCCPNDAANEVREVVDYISIKKGGEGCVRDIIEQILTIQKNWIENE